MAERVIRELRDAGAEDEELAIAEKVLRMWERGELSSEEAYYLIVGMARERFIPLTPRQVASIRTALGLPREW